MVERRDMSQVFTTTDKNDKMGHMLHINWTEILTIPFLVTCQNGTPKDNTILIDVTVNIILASNKTRGLHTFTMRFIKFTAAIVNGITLSCRLLKK